MNFKFRFLLINTFAGSYIHKYCFYKLLLVSAAKFLSREEVKFQSCAESLSTVIG
jgi:hypothetical protein